MTNQAVPGGPWAKIFARSLTPSRIGIISSRTVKADACRADATAVGAEKA
jgi:hypothetical protein